MTSNAKRVIAQISAAGFTDVGPSRSHNQDAIVLGTTIGLGDHAILQWSGLCEESVTFAVVDGMGGYDGGAEAAALVAAAMARYKMPTDLSATVEQFRNISNRVSEAGKAWGAPKMGAAFAALCLAKESLLFLNVGDCRAYKINGNYLGQMSVDDRISTETSAITQAIGGTNNIDPHAWSQNPGSENERYLLCSDGIWGTLSQETLLRICRENVTAIDAVNRIWNEMQNHEITDNFSALIIDAITQEEEPRQGEGRVR
ncbi:MULTISPECIES: PP2C family serine/threonine-protein phosphatase [unclassified Adlercreutzia]|uniref:PP2C family protein-serine/threonine phosphatase n=1 Tax=unclassified Adlercreutzia TaxID=2636013 RepID=UPI0013EE237E|nr:MULTISPECIES: PP2C family serine/threonine-protein phosphatase [unclassified Adlercreutzia]